jgi:hypothetical protein
MELPAHADGRHPIAAGPRESEIGARAEIDELIHVAGLITGARIRAEPEEPPGEALLVAAEGVDAAALLHDHPTGREILVVQPAAPDRAIFLLPLRRVGKERPQKLAAALTSKVDVGEGDAPAGADVLLEEELRGDEGRNEEPLEDISRHDAPLGQVAPALGIGQIVGQRDFRDSATALHPLERIVFRPTGILRLGRERNGEDGEHQAKDQGGEREPHA